VKYCNKYIDFRHTAYNCFHLAATFTIYVNIKYIFNEDALLDWCNLLQVNAFQFGFLLFITTYMQRLLITKIKSSTSKQSILVDKTFVHPFYKLNVSKNKLLRK